MNSPAHADTEARRPDPSFSKDQNSAVLTIPDQKHGEEKPQTEMIGSRCKAGNSVLTASDARNTVDIALSPYVKNMKQRQQKRKNGHRKQNRPQESTATNQADFGKKQNNRPLK
ncbi:MAG: hypothetical protein ACK5TG_20660 [Planctomyces sp.]|jgi:hypothetical protein|nr:hypothetical protein [Planctomyces sp.]